MEAEERAQKIKEREKQIRERDLSDLKKILGYPEGRRFVWRVLDKSETFSAKATEKKEVGLMLFAEIMDIAPESYLQMQREYKSERISIKKQFPIENEDD